MWTTIKKTWLEVISKIGYDSLWVSLPWAVYLLHHNWGEFEYNHIKNKYCPKWKYISAVLDWGGSHRHHDSAPLCSRVGMTLQICKLEISEGKSPWVGKGRHWWTGAKNVLMAARWDATGCLLLPLAARAAAPGAQNRLFNIGLIDNLMKRAETGKNIPCDEKD